MIEKSIKVIEELEKIYKKINLLERKKESMGLTEEEEEFLQKIKTHYTNECNVVIGELIEYIINQLLSIKGINALKKIQGIIDWNGKRLMQEEEFERIISKSAVLDIKKIKIIEKELNILHEDVFKGLESICQSKTMFNMLDNLGKNLRNHDDGNIIDVVQYIDNIYKDFADIFEIELAEIKLFYY